LYETRVSGENVVGWNAKAFSQAPISDEMGDVSHVEDVGYTPDAIAVTVNGEALLKSRFGQKSIPRTLWVVRRSAPVTLAVNTGYMCEGFEVNFL
jgi:hypothetical protein